MASYYQTALSWAFVLATTAALTYYYRPEAFHRLLLAPNLSTHTQPEERKASKKLKQRAFKTIKQGDIKQKTPTENRAQDRKVEGISSAIQVSGNIIAQGQNGKVATLRGDEAGALSDKDFAQELRRAQAGTKLERRTGLAANQGKRKRDHKDSVEVNGDLPKMDQRQKPNSAFPQSSSTTKPAMTTPSETSSTTGRDGDDDMSGTGSPLSTAATSRAGDISDMLEPAASRPMTLSITNVNNASQKSKPQSRQFEAAETKKQRQRRLKRDQKLEVARSNAEHEKKKQNQLRTARMADGSSAQLKTNSFKATGQNAWKSTPQVPPMTHSGGSTTQLLDTMEPAAELNVSINAVTSKPADSVASMSQALTAQDMKSKFGNSITSALGASGREAQPNGLASLDWADDVTEDELRRRGILREAECEWQDVTARKGKKRGPKVDDASSDARSGINRSNGIDPQTGVNRFHSFQSQVE